MSAAGRPQVPVALAVNGRPQRLLLEPRTTLLEALRLHLGLTGTKAGCGHGNCGACTVLVDDRPQYACLRLAVDCDDQPIQTVEGLASHGGLNPVQQAFVDHDGMQCGFCTPGQVMSAEALRRRGAPAEDGVIEQGMSGNLCRCGAYVGIRAAVRQALEAS